MLSRTLASEKPDPAALANRNFPDAPRALRLLDSLAKPATPERAALLEAIDPLADELEHSADPMRALLNLTNVVDAAPSRQNLLQELAEDPRFRRRLCGLCGFAQSIADSLARRPEWLALLRDDCALPSRAELRASAATDVAGHDEKTALDGLRRWRKRETVRLAVFDFERPTWRDEAAFARLTRGISDLAIVAIQTALEILAPGRRDFCAILMGKGGARELNYSSDVDLIFIGDGDPVANEKLGTALLKALNDSTTEGTLWRADMRLRPDGKSGSLVTSIGYAFGYYESFAAAWEWQALIKARAVAGDAKLGRRFRRFTRGITWARRADDEHIGEMLEMKRRMELTADGSDPANVKTGPGAIRDAEWVVQQLQMMAGPTHPRARAKSTLNALRHLEELDTLSRDEAGALRDGYLFLRVVEHRLQLMDERAVRVVPAKDEERGALARRMGETARGAVAARRFDEEHARHRRDIRGQSEKLFWAWSAEHPDAPITGPLAVMTGASKESQTRIERIAAGTASRPFPAPLVRQIRAALPAALASLHHAADMERALVNLENLCEASGNRLSLLRSLGESRDLGRAVFALLGGSSRLSETLIRAPELLDMAANRERLSERKTLEQARFECRDWCAPFADKKAALRRWKARELLRIGLRDLALQVPATEITAELADLCQSCLMFATETLVRDSDRSVDFAVLGMGKLGGGELHYNSDADVLFAYDVPPGLQPGPGAQASATKLAEELTKLMGERTPDGVCFEVDARLRPDGKSSPLARGVQGFVEYFERPTGGLAVWERQALTRARYVAGDPSVSGRLMAAIRAVAFPDVWQPEWSDELRRIKGRVEHERGSGRGFYDVKLGSGTISDIEWTAQWLAMKHGAQHPALQTPGTLNQLNAARAAGLLTEADWQSLQSAYTWLRRAELRLQITSETGAKPIKHASHELDIWARAVYPDTADSVARFAAAWEEHTVRVRTIFEEVRDKL